MSLLPLFIGLGTGAILFAAGNPPSPDRLPVICPAIDQEENGLIGRLESDNDDPIDAGHEAKRPVELVVVGTAKPIGADKQQAEVQVEKVLYGGLAEKSVTILADVEIKPGRQIFVLTSSFRPRNPPYAMKYAASIEEEHTHTALAAARLDYFALSAACVFVGKELSVNLREGRHKVHVERVLSGGPWQAGESVRLQSAQDNLVRSDGDYTPRIAGSPMIYFVGETKLSRVLHPEEDAQHRDWAIIGRIAVAREGDVLAALRRRGDYPLTEADPHWRTPPAREVIFRGSIPEAIKLLGAAPRRDHLVWRPLVSPGVLLGEHMLLRNCQAVRPVLRAAIQDEWFRQADGPPDRYGRLRYAIKVLGEIGQGTPDGDVGRLVEKFLAHVATTPAEPAPVPPHRPGGHGWFVRDLTIDDYCQEYSRNHALAWMLATMSQGDVVRRDGRGWSRCATRPQGDGRTNCNLRWTSAASRTAWS